MVNPNTSEKEYSEIVDFGPINYMDSFYKYSNTTIITYGGVMIGDFKVEKHFSNFKNEEPNAIVVINSQSLRGVISNKGKLLIPCEYKSIQIIDNKLILTSKDDNINVFGMMGDPLCQLKFNDFKINKSKELGLIYLKFKKKWGVLNLQGTIKVPFIFDNLGSSHKNYIEVLMKKKWGIYDFEKNELILPCEHLSIKHIYLNYFSVLKDDKWGIHDIESNILCVPFIYDGIKSINSENIGVFEKEKWGLLNLINHSVVIPPKYDDITYLTDDTYGVLIRSKWAIFNSYSKNLVIEPIYDKFVDCRFNRIAVVLNNKFGIIDVTGRKIVETLYDNIRIDSESLFYAYIIDSEAFEFDCRPEKGHWDFIDSNNHKKSDAEIQLISESENGEKEVNIRFNPDYDSSVYWKVDQYFNQCGQPIWFNDIE